MANAQCGSSWIIFCHCYPIKFNAIFFWKILNAILTLRCMHFFFSQNATSLHFVELNGRLLRLFLVFWLIPSLLHHIHGSLYVYISWTLLVVLKVLIKWLNLLILISLNFWNKWYFNMVSKPEYKSSNFDSINSLPFQLNIPHVGPQLKKWSLSP